MEIARFLLNRVRQPLVWLLVLALVAYGCSSTLVQVLGPAHRHATPGAGAALGQFVSWSQQTVRAVRQWREQVLESLPVSGGAYALRHAHRNDESEPHTHGDSGPLHLHGHSQPHADAQPHVHDHGDFVRHHHDPLDASVVVLGSADGAAAAGAGSAMLTLALAPQPVLPAPSCCGWLGSVGGPPSWTDAALRVPTRPPRT